MDENKVNNADLEPKTATYSLNKIAQDAAKVGDDHIEQIRFIDALKTDYGTDFLIQENTKRLDFESGDWFDRHLPQSVKNKLNIASSSLGTILNDLWWGQKGVIGGKLPLTVGAMNGDKELADLSLYYLDAVNFRKKIGEEEIKETFRVEDPTLADEVVGGILAGIAQAGITTLGTLINPALGIGVLVGSSAAAALADSANYTLESDLDLTREEFLERQRNKTVAEHQKDLAGGAFVATTNFMIDALSGANPAAAGLKGGAKSFVKRVAKSALEEAVGEVGQDLSGTVYDVLIGRKSFGELVDKLWSREELVTFLSAAFTGGFFASSEYHSSRQRVGDTIRAKLRENNIDLTGAQEEALVQAAQDFAEGIGVQAVRDRMVDDQLKNKYGISRDSIRNRLNELVIATSEQDENIKPFVVSEIEQDVIENLYIEARDEGAPISVVFDESRLYVDEENNTLNLQFGEDEPIELASLKDGEIFTRTRKIESQMMEDIASGEQSLNDAISYMMYNTQLAQQTDGELPTTVYQSWRDIQNEYGIGENESIIPKRQIEQITELYEKYVAGEEVSEKARPWLEFVDDYLAERATPLVPEQSEVVLVDEPEINTVYESNGREYRRTEGQGTQIIEALNKDGSGAGRIEIKIREDGTAAVEAIDVNEEQRRQKIGTQLVEEASRYYDIRQARGIDPDARAFWKTLGYDENGRRFTDAKLDRLQSLTSRDLTATEIEQTETLIGRALEKETPKVTNKALNEVAQATDGQVVTNPYTGESWVAPKEEKFLSDKKGKSKLPQTARKALNKTKEDIPDVEYNRRSMSKAKEAARSLVDTDEGRALEILKSGVEQVDGLYAGDIYRALIDKYEADGNFMKIRQIVQDAAPAAREAGRAVKSFDLERGPYTYEEAIGALDAEYDKIANKKRNKEKIDADVARLRRFVRDRESAAKAWEDFKKLVECK